jgi:phage terminase large subunit
MDEFELPAYGWSPRVDQLPYWNRMLSPHFRRGVLACHRRYGKDELGLQVMAVKAMERTGSYWYALPEYEHARKAIWQMVNWRTKRTRIDDAFPPEIVAHKDNEAMMLTLRSGSTVQLVGTDRIDSLVGGGQIGIVASEAALSKPEFSLFVQPILEESGGWMLEVSTPRGKNHFYKSLLSAQEDMAAGTPGVFGAHIDASKSTVFPKDQLSRIHRDLLRKHGNVIGEAVFQQEYMVSFDAAIVGAVWGQELTEMQLQGRVRSQPYDKRFPVMTSWDIGVGDATVILFWQQISGAYVLIDSFESNDMGLDPYIAVLKQWHTEKGYRYGTHYGPHDVAQREWLPGVQRIDEARRRGLDFKRTPNTRVATQLACASALIRQMIVNSDSPGAMAALERFKAYRFPRNKATGAIVPTPVHDDASHASSALCTLAVNAAASLGRGQLVQDDQLSSGAGELTALGGGFRPGDFGPAPWSNGPWAPPQATRPLPATAFG